MPVGLTCRWMFASACSLLTLGVTNECSRYNLHEPRSDGGRADQPRRTRLRHFLAAPERAHHLRDRSGRRWHVDAGCRPADRESTRLNSTHTDIYRMPSSAL